MLTPSNSLLLWHWADAGVRLPQSDVELSSFVVEIVIVHFEKRTPPALTLEKNGIGFVFRHDFVV